jgi:hypothetical protein
MSAGHQYKVDFSLNIESLLFEHLKLAKSSMIHWLCVKSGDSAELHHVKRARKVLKSNKPNSFNVSLKAMRLAHCKTFLFCKNHHL